MNLTPDLITQFIPDWKLPGDVTINQVDDDLFTLEVRMHDGSTPVTMVETVEDLFVAYYEMRRFADRQLSRKGK